MNAKYLRLTLPINTPIIKQGMNCPIHSTKPFNIVFPIEMKHLLLDSINWPEFVFGVSVTSLMYPLYSHIPPIQICIKRIDNCIGSMEYYKGDTEFYNLHIKTMEDAYTHIRNEIQQDITDLMKDQIDGEVIKKLREKYSKKNNIPKKQHIPDIWTFPNVKKNKWNVPKGAPMEFDEFVKTTEYGPVIKEFLKVYNDE